MEMEEYGEANSYIEKVYGRITAVSRVLKTASAPINALLQVKLGQVLFSIGQIRHGVNGIVNQV